MRGTRLSFSIVGLLLIGVAGATIAYRFRYPYGWRPACLPCVLGALRTYALNHNGNFPTDTQGPQEALRQLYPVYLADWKLLAGLSGDRKELERDMSGHLGLSDSASSWVYWPGLKLDDDPDIAVIWERRSGVRFDGSRAHGREVGFVGGDMRQISDAAWGAFVRDQAQMREQAFTARKGN
jgi:hypothetical protein